MKCMQVVKKLNINKTILSILFFCCCFSTQQVKAQQQKPSYFGSFELYNPIKYSSVNSPIFLLDKATPLPHPMSLTVPKQMPVAFFCIKEHYMDKKTRINPRFRLGSVDYVNQLEGKLNQIK